MNDHVEEETAGWFCFRRLVGKGLCLGALDGVWAKIVAFLVLTSV